MTSAVTPSLHHASNFFSGFYNELLYPWSHLAAHLFGQTSEQEFPTALQDWIFNHPPKPLPSSSLFAQIKAILDCSKLNGYFSLVGMPVYLVPKQFLELKSETLTIDSRNHVQLLSFIDTASQLQHFNYRLKNPLEWEMLCNKSWDMLCSAVGGFPVKRFLIASQGGGVQPQIQLQLLKVALVYGRAVLGEIEIQCGRHQVIESVLSRLQRLCIAYSLLQLKHLKKPMQLLRGDSCNFQYFLTILQDWDFHDSETALPSNRVRQIHSSSLLLKKVPLFGTVGNCQLEGALIVLLVGNPFGPFNMVSQMSVTVAKRCGVCGVTSSLRRCPCENIYFCSSFCGKQLQSHLKCVETKTTLATSQRQLQQLKKLYPSCEKWREGIIQGVRGLANLGNTCFLNAGLQFLLSCASLLRPFMEGSHHSQLNISNPLGSGGHMACAFASFISNYFTQSEGVIRPQTILRLVSKNSQFKGRNHQDCQQFISYFMDKLHEDLNRAKNKDRTEPQENEEKREEAMAEMAWKEFQHKNNSLISDLFAGQYRSQIQCPHCKKVSITFDPFISVTLPLPQFQRVKGYFVDERGQMSEVNTLVRPNQLSAEFGLQYFGRPVVIVVQKDRKIVSEWLPFKSVKSHLGVQGSLFFFPRPANALLDFSVQVLIEPPLRGPPPFTRKLYVQRVEDFRDLSLQLALVLKYPLCKALDEPLLSDEDYLSFIQKQGVIGEVVPSQAIFYPLSGNRSMKLKVRLKAPSGDSEFQFKNEIKLNHFVGNVKPHSDYPVGTSSKRLTLRNMLDEFELPEVLEYENEWFCSHCKELRQAPKNMRLCKLPKFLLLHLKRFNQRRRGEGTKIDSAVILQERETVNGLPYTLEAIVCHTGSLSFGHYIAYVRRQHSWYLCDDSRIHKRQYDSTDAYLALLRKVDSQQSE